MTFPILYIETQDFVLFDDVANCHCQLSYNVAKYFEDICLLDVFADVEKFKTKISGDMNIEVHDLMLLDTYKTFQLVESLTPLPIISPKQCKNEIHRIDFIWEKKFYRKSDPKEELKYLKMTIVFAEKNNDFLRCNVNLLH